MIFSSLDAQIYNTVNENAVTKRILVAGIIHLADTTSIYQLHGGRPQMAVLDYKGYGTSGADRRLELIET